MKKSNGNKYDLNGDFGIGYCAGSNTQFFFDLDDFDKIKNFIWSLRKSEYGNYVHARINGRWTYLHKFLTGTNSDQLIDHINRNNMDCRKCNLRICNDTQNSANHKMRVGSSSGIIGVAYSKRDGLWLPSIRKDGKKINLGQGKDKEEAIIKRLKAEKEVYGEFAPQRHLFKEYGIE